MSNLRPLSSPVDNGKVDALMAALHRRAEMDLMERLGFQPEEIAAVVRYASIRNVRVALVVRALVTASLEAMGERLD